MANAAELLEIDHVRQAFPKAGGGELLVLDDVNLTLHEGEIVGLLGRSGSGKSTLLRLVAGLARPVAGTCTISAIPCAAAPPASRWCSRASRCSPG